MNRSTATIDIILADDHLIVLEALGNLLSHEPNLRIIGQAKNGSELVELTTNRKPQIVITDIAMPVMDGIEATERIIDRLPETGVIALSNFDETNLILDVLEAGGRGYLLKNAGKQELLQAIQLVHQGGTYYSKELADKLTAAAAQNQLHTLQVPGQPSFNRLEVKTIKLLCRQLSSKEIADKLEMDKRFIDSLRIKIQRKIGARNLAGIIIYAIRNRLFRVD